MKKSKIIVPAIAMIAFSTAASIAGSVAWFTASRQVTINAGTYAVVKTTSNLDAVLTGGVGTTVNESTVSFTGKLTDGSFSHANGNIYTPKQVGKDVKIDADKVYPVSTATAAQLLRTTLPGNVPVYTAATFEIAFSMNFGAGANDVALYLNAASSSFTNQSGGDAKTAKGFRMAFYPKTTPTGSSSVAKVFADLQLAAKCKYVAGTDNETGTAYEANTLVDSAYTTAVPESADVSTARPDYLGTFKAPATAGVVTIVYTVVAWFEGTDEEIRNRNINDEYQEVAASLTFDAVDCPSA